MDSMCYFKSIKNIFPVGVKGRKGGEYYHNALYKIFK